MMQTVLLGDISKKITKGTTPTTYGSSFKDNGINFIKVESISEDGSFITDKFMYIDEDTHNNLLKRSIIEEGDILLTMAGAIGRVAQVPARILPANTSQAVSIIRIKTELADRRYVRYFLESPYAKNQFLGGITQSAQPNLSLGNISKIQVLLPEREAQKKIADILSSLDEKIELNRKMNETLEQIGQALFRHYFIDNPEAKNLGLTTVGQKIHPKRGKSLSSKNMKEGLVKVVSGGLQPAGFHDVPNTKSPVITISASGANAGFVSLWNEDVWSADSSFIDKTITDNVYFYYIFLKLNQNKIYGMQTGAAQPHIAPSNIEMMEIGDIPDDLIAEFDSCVSGLFDLIASNKKEMANLIDLRDAILPRLISGKIKI